MPSGGLRLLVRVVVSPNQLRCDLELGGRLLGVGIVHLGLEEFARAPRARSRQFLTPVAGVGVFQLPMGCRIRRY